MKQRQFDKRQLDRLGRDLLASARLSETEIDNIAGAPHLLAAVRAEIEARRPARKAAARFFGFEWRTAAVSLALLAAFAVCAAALLRRPAPELSAVKPPAAGDRFDDELKDRKAFVQNPLDETGDGVKLRKPFADRHPEPEKASFKPAAPAKASPKRTPPRPKRPAAPASDPDGVFYALPYAGHTESEDLRIVRTELTPKSLFALGVNVSVENESAKIKTDLLVGSDGQARAIRFVK